MKIKITDEISLEELRVIDADALFQEIEDNRKMLEQYLYWAKNVVDLDTTRQYIAERVNSDKAGSDWSKIVFNGKAVGVFGIKSICGEILEAKIGYWLSKTAQGHGIISQAIASVSQYLKKQGVENLKITCLHENKSSIAVAKRAGAKHVETIPQYMTINGKTQHLNIYKMLL